MFPKQFIKEGIKMKNKVTSLLFFAAIFFSLPAWSYLITSSSSADTYITEYNAIGGANSVNDAASSLYAITANGGSPAFRSYPLIQFDLSAYYNHTVIGDALFEMYVQGTNFGRDSARQVGVHQVLIDWDSTTANYNNFGTAPGVQFGTDVLTALDSISVTYPGIGDRYISWQIPQAIVQSWIDDSSSNFGLLIENQELSNGTDLQFGSRESQNAPRLTFVAVPEPGALLLIVFGLFLIGRRNL